MGTTCQSITLANSIIGVGILAMPFCFQQCGMFLATLILLFMGLISRLCCYFLLKSAFLARRRNFEFLAFHVFGPAGKMAVEVGIIGFLMGTCIAYFVVVGDLGPQIIAKMFNINQSDILRTLIMVVVSLVCVLPLGLLRNVDSLSNVSAATICFYFCLVMKVITEAASQLVKSEWHRRVEMWRPAGLLQCVPIFSMALFCQTQLFEIFESLPSISLEKMNVVTKNAINICTAVYFTLGVFGYIAFCSQDISGNILISLSPTMANDVIKLGFVMSVAFSFPLIIFPCRASLYSFLYKKVHSSHHDHTIDHSIPETTFRCITVAIIAVALFISLLIPNIELVLGLVGSTIGVLICVVFPAACFVNVTFKNTNERVLAKGVIVLGLIIMVLGTYANLEAASDKVDRYEDKYTPENIDKIVEDFFEKRDKNYKPSKPDESLQKLHSVIDQGQFKESEAQPPNPVPPESQSNEKPAAKLNALKNEEKKIIPIQDIKNTADKVIDTHPKNVKTKLEANFANGVDKAEQDAQKDIKTQLNQDKIDIMKQQKLIETIKQHGEEQKELMKEQKEILDEIIKTKKELEQNKNEAETNDAKKIAVESIKQIANMAIQSLGGVSEKPVQVNNKNSDRLEKLTINDAVQEIAKKAVETIEAIQDINEIPDETNAAKNVPVIQNSVVNGNIPQVNPQNVQPNLQQQANLQNVQQVNAQILQQANAQIVQNNPSNIKREINSAAKQPDTIPHLEQVVNPQIQNANKPIVNSVVQQNIQANVLQNNVPVLPNTAQNIPINPPTNNQNNVPINPPANIAQNNPAQAPINNPAASVIQNNPPAQTVQVNPQSNGAQNSPVQLPNNAQINPAAIVQNNPANNPQNIAPAVNIPQNNAPVLAQDNLKHLHSLDEPQSYKQGEDAQVGDSNIRQKPLSVGDLLSIKQIQEKVAVAQQMDADIKVIESPKSVNVQQNIRQKREAIVCSEKLEPKLKELCDTVVIGPVEENDKILPPVDLNSVVLHKSLSFDNNMLHHIGRKLKYFERDER